MNAMIYILLAAYNGEKFIREQIDSLLAQTVQDFKLFVSDDRSTDSTDAILRDYARAWPEKIFVSRRQENTGSPKHNFTRMMIEHKSDYVMLCDQDDVWLPDKIEKSLREMQAMERLYGSDLPIAITTDLSVVDAELRLIAESCARFMNGDGVKTSLSSVIVQCPLTGCTAMYNRALADLIRAEPDYMVMHDWWLALAASAFGKIGRIPEPTVLYRQHGENNTGAKNMRSLKFIVYKMTHSEEMKSAIDNTYTQARSFLEVYRDDLLEHQRQLLETYISVPGMNKWKRARTIWKLRTLKQGVKRKVAQFIVV